MTTHPCPRPQPPPPPLDPALLRVIEALARADARRDYAAALNPPPAAPTAS